MCGRLNITDNAGVRALMAMLGLAQLPAFHRDIAPGAPLDFVCEADGRHLRSGYWSLLMDAKPDGSGLRPNPKFRTFNARSDRLLESRLWREPYRHHRCIVPATGFHEWRGKTCYYITPADGTAFALAGLYRQAVIKGETVFSCTVITLPGQPAFAHIHDNSFPFVLLPEDFGIWLDPGFDQVEAFRPLMTRGIRGAISVTPVDSPRTLQPIGETELILAERNGG